MFQIVRRFRASHNVGLVVAARTMAAASSAESIAATDDGRCALRIHPLKPFHNVAHLQRMIREDAQITDFIAVFKKQNRDIGFVTFGSEQARADAMSKLLELRRPDSDKPYSVQEAPFMQESATQKRAREATVERSRKRQLRNTGDPEHQETILKAVADVVTPWHAVQYLTQLQRKMSQLQDALTSIMLALRKDYRNDAARYPDLDLKGVARADVPVHLHDHVTLDVTETDTAATAAPHPFLACPIVGVHGWATGRQGYRNKNDLTVGYDADGAVCVGFVAGRQQGRLVIGSAADALPLPPIAARIAADAQTFLRGSCWTPFAQQGHDDEATGVWRRFLIRTASTTGQVMVAVAADLSRLSSDEIATLKAQLATEFRPDRYGDNEIGGQRWRIETVVLQNFGGYGNVIPSDLPYECVTGNGFIVEHLGRLAFQIQPGSFFQVNTHGARLLYDLVGELAVADRERDNVIAADVCCGTGTIGMTLHDRVREVLGFELVPSAVDDARLNAERNGLEHCQFFVGKAEETLSPIITKHMAATASGTELICIVDPPRPGLHKSVLKAIRMCDQIRRVVYVSCNPKSMAVDVTALMRPQGDKRPGRPFRPVQATLVDMFPHTDHCESIVLLARD